MKLTHCIPAWPRIAAISMLAFITAVLVWANVPATGASPEISQARIIELEDNEKTLNLAVEFGFDPMIVKVARQTATREYVKRACACKTWRFIGSADALAYAVMSIIQMESRGNYRAVNLAGPAYGLTQFVMSTARQYDKNVSQDELLTIPRNLELAMEHFVDLLEQADGNHLLAFAAWNQGSSVIRRSAALGGDVGNSYAHAVLARAAMRNAE